ncbi:MAG: MBL fold metallo-hydrolase [Leptolyngbya sp. PLA1]|nr:MBL fold metallo-hydrolase [Leptolyngbya sp. PLA1]
MRFTFLGTGTSSGIPAIGCDCATCVSSDPRDQRLRCAASIQFIDPQGRPRGVLIDAGPDLRQQVLRFGVRRCDAILFTHNHVDHVFGLDETRRFNAVQRGPIEVYADDHTMDSLERVYEHIFSRDQNVNDSFVATLMPRRITRQEIAAGTPLDLFGMRVTPIPLLHGRLPVLGYRVEAGPELSATMATPQPDPEARVPEPPFPLAYCTDVSAIPPESWGRLTGLRTLVLDALRHRHHPTHLTLDQAVAIARRVGAERTYFIHMSHDLAHEATNRELPDGMRLAYDGLVLG